MGISKSELHEDGAAASVAVQVRAERLSSLQARVAMPAGVGALFALLPVVLLWPHLPVIDLLGWLGARWGISLWRTLQARRFLTLPLQERASPREERRYLVGLGLDGLAWGVIGALFATPNLPEIDGAVMTTLVGLVAFTMVSLGHWARGQALFASLVISVAPMPSVAE